MRDKVSEMMVIEKKIALIEKVCPIVENVQAQAKTLRKEKKCPEELEKDVAVVIYLADVFSIPSFLRVKHQFTFKYGEKYIEKICGKKHTNVDEEIVAMVEYKPESKAVKERAKQVTEDCKKREKEEEKAESRASPRSIIIRRSRLPMSRRARARASPSLRRRRSPRRRRRRKRRRRRRKSLSLNPRAIKGFYLSCLLEVFVGESNGWLLWGVYSCSIEYLDL